MEGWANAAAPGAPCLWEAILWGAPGAGADLPRRRTYIAPAPSSGTPLYRWRALVARCCQNAAAALTRPLRCLCDQI